MRKIQILLLSVLLLLVSNRANAQDSFARGDGSTSLGCGNTLGVPCPGGVDAAGNVYLKVPTTPFPFSQSLVEMTPAPMVTILPTALPTAYPTPQFPAVAAGLKSAWISNTTNQDIWCSYSSTSGQIFVPAGATWWDNFAAKGIKVSTGIGCIHPAATPASGYVAIGGEN